jgi:release factor glutamine methyltransferase
MTLDEGLALARQKIPASEARLLLGHVLQRDAAWLAAHGDEALLPAQAVLYERLVARRAAGEPVAYLVGQREFYGRSFSVSPAVLIPRPETELLVEAAALVMRALSAPRVLDLGTGSGCIAVTLALECRDAALTAVDVSSTALSMARDNADRLGARVEFVESDWFAALTGRRFDLIVSNPPYIASGDPHLRLGDLRFEPATALSSGRDGLDALECIVSQSAKHLEPGGCLLFEHGYDQAETAGDLLRAAGFVGIRQLRDLAGIVRVSGGRRA